MVDYLANLAVNNTLMQEYKHFNKLSVRGMRIINIKKRTNSYFNVEKKET